MEIRKSSFTITIFGKCTTQKDIIDLYNFGYSKESIVKKYRQDNRLKDEEARKTVEKTLLETILKMEKKADRRK